MVKKVKKGKNKKQLALITDIINNDLIADVSNAKIVKTVIDKVKEEGTPDGDATVDTESGQIRIRKTTNAETKKARVTLQLEGKQIARSPLYNLVKEGKKPEWHPDYNKKESKKEKTDETGPSKKILAAKYKKKQVVNVLTKLQAFKKKIIEGIKANIDGKKVDGSTLITIMDDVTGEETPLETINKIFAELN